MSSRAKLIAAFLALALCGCDIPENNVAVETYSGGRVHVTVYDPSTSRVMNSYVLEADKSGNLIPFVPGSDHDDK